jgi:hypothetical protein
MATVKKIVISAIFMIYGSVFFVKLLNLWISRYEMQQYMVRFHEKLFWQKTFKVRAGSKSAVMIPLCTQWAFTQEFRLLDILTTHCVFLKVVGSKTHKNSLNPINITSNFSSRQSRQ